jgi:hypothetical protein
VAQDTFALAQRVIFEKMIPEASKIFGEKAARQLLFKIVKDAVKELVEEDGAQFESPCEAFKYLRGIPEPQSLECGESVTVKFDKCPLRLMLGKDTNLGCTVVQAIWAGLLESWAKDKVFVDSPVGKFGVYKAPYVLKVEECKGEGGCTIRFVRRNA